MISKRRIETGFDIDDPIGCFANDSMLLWLVRSKFEGRCFRSCWIQSVDRITRQSECTILHDSNSMKGSMNLEFEATCVTYPDGWVIVGCKVESVNEKKELIICRRDQAHITMKRQNLTASITVGQIIPVQIMKVKYNINSPDVAMLGVMFTPPLRPKIYHIRDKTYDPAITEQLRADIAAEEQLHKALIQTSGQSYESFRRLLSPYVKPQVLPASMRALTLDPTTWQGFVARDGILDLLTPQCVGYEELPLGQTPIEASLNEVAVALLQDYYKYLRVQRDMIAWYKDPEVVTAHKNIWTIYGSLKTGRNV